jgi:hypothetical protein
MTTSKTTNSSEDEDDDDLWGIAREETVEKIANARAILDSAAFCPVVDNDGYNPLFACIKLGEAPINSTLYLNSSAEGMRKISVVMGFVDSKEDRDVRPPERETSLDGKPEVFVGARNLRPNTNPKAESIFLEVDLPSGARIISGGVYKLPEESDVKLDAKALATHRGVPANVGLLPTGVLVLSRREGCRYEFCSTFSPERLAEAHSVLALRISLGE